MSEKSVPYYLSDQLTYMHELHSHNTRNKYLLQVPHSHTPILSAAERRGTPVLLSASVSDNSGNSPQMATLRSSREIDQSTQRFHVGCDN